MSARRPEIADRAEQAIEELRGRAGWLARRLLFVGPEVLDLASVPPGLKRRVLEDLDRVGRVLLLDPYLERRVGRMLVEARRTRRGRPVRLLQVGARPRALLARLEAWARRRHIAVELNLVDPDPLVVESARRRSEEEGRRLDARPGELTALPWEPGGVDVVVSTFLLHRLAPGDAARHLAEVDRVAAVNYLVFDARRTLAAVPILGALLRILGVDAPTRHDAMATLRKGLTADEAEALVRSAGLEHVRVVAARPSWLAITRA